jgi:hypothetical protein
VFMRLLFFVGCLGALNAGAVGPLGDTLEERVQRKLQVLSDCRARLLQAPGEAFSFLATNGVLQYPDPSPLIIELLGHSAFYEVLEAMMNGALPVPHGLAERELRQNRRELLDRWFSQRSNSLQEVAGLWGRNLSDGANPLDVHLVGELALRPLSHIIGELDQPEDQDLKIAMVQLKTTIALKALEALAENPRFQASPFWHVASQSICGSLDPTHGSTSKESTSVWTTAIALDLASPCGISNAERLLHFAPDRAVGLFVYFANHSSVRDGKVVVSLPTEKSIAFPIAKSFSKLAEAGETQGPESEQDRVLALFLRSILEKVARSTAVPAESASRLERALERFKNP